MGSMASAIEALPRLLGTDEAAPIVGVSAQTLHDWRQADKGPPYLRVGRKIVYLREDLDAWLAARRVVPGGGCA